MNDYIERVVDLLDPSLNQIHNLPLEEARRRVPTRRRGPGEQDGITLHRHSGRPAKPWPTNSRRWGAASENGFGAVKDDPASRRVRRPSRVVLFARKRRGASPRGRRVALHSRRGIALWCGRAHGGQPAFASAGGGPAFPVFPSHPVRQRPSPPSLRTTPDGRARHTIARLCPSGSKPRAARGRPLSR